MALNNLNSKKTIGLQKPVLEKPCFLLIINLFNTLSRKTLNWISTTIHKIDQ